MKDISLLVWLTQLGLSVAFPLAGFVLLGVWLHQSCGWGQWSVFAGIFLGLLSAVNGLRSCLSVLSRSARSKNEEQNTVSFNEHD